VCDAASAAVEEAAMFGKDKSSGGAPQQSIGDMMRMAQSMQADAMQQAQAMSGATAGAAVGSMTWARQVLALIAPPQPGYVKRCSCTNCGAPKKLPSVTAYVYCDYCGSLVDYDLRRASESDVPVGIEYANLVNGLQRNCLAAQAAGDRDGYRAMQRQLYDAYVTTMANAVSHRARNDVSYRQQLVDYMAESAVMTAFEPELVTLTGEMQQRAMGLRYTGTMTVDPDSFWPMCETLNRQIEATARLAPKYGLDERNPDRATHLNTKLACSSFCQGWLPFLPAESAAQLIEWAGLTNSYVEIDVADGRPRGCGGCGSRFTSLPGASLMVCEGCGRQLDVGAAEIPCTGCGASMTLPPGASDTNCPYCQTYVRKVGIV
jgi:LSD1 subclass zinc finger protein